MNNNLLRKVLFPLLNLKNIPAKIKLKINEILNSIKVYHATVKDKLKNILPTNINLGKYHIAKNNLNDAILRFKIILKFFDKENLEAKYYLAITYLVKGKKDKAEEILKNQPDYKNAAVILNMIKQENTLPKEFAKEIRNIEALKYQEDIYEDEYLLVDNFCKEVFEVVNPINQNDSILEINPGNGYLGVAIKDLTAEIFHFKAIESAENYFKIINNLKNNNMRIYNECIIGEFTDILTKKEEYNYIFSLWGLEFDSNIGDNLKKITNSLKPEGILAFTLHTSSTEENFKLTNNSKHYIFNKDYLEKEIEKLKNLKTIIIKNIAIEKINGYILVVQKIK